MTPQQFSAWLRKQPQAIQGAVVRGLRSAAHRGVGVVVREIDTAEPYPAVNTGGLRGSVRSENTTEGARIVVDAPHAAIINNGTRPFRPPLGPIVAWVVRKFSVPESEAYPIAKAVCDKIEAQGIAPRHFWEKAMVEIEKLIDTEVQHELNLIGAKT